MINVVEQESSFPELQKDGRQVEKIVTHEQKQVEKIVTHAHKSGWCFVEVEHVTAHRTK